MRENVFVILLMANLSLFFSGCAVPGQKHLVEVTSKPSGAEVYIDSNFIGQTPCDVVVESGSDAFVWNSYLIRVSKLGYKDKIIPLNEDGLGWFPGKLRVLLERNDGLSGLRNKESAPSGKTSSNIHQMLDVSSGINWRAPDKSRIVCIGIRDYVDKVIPSVTHAVNDALTFTSFAQQAGVPQVKITTLTNENATRSAIIKAINILKMATTEQSETAIFYFSGHGAPLIKDGKIYAGVIIPYDASGQSLEDTGIKLDWIKEKLGDLPGNSIIILDACFTGKEGRSLMAKNLKGVTIAPGPKTFIPQPNENTWWLTATSGDNFANDLPKESHGLFTYYFLKALSGAPGVDTDEDGLITIKEAFAWTKDKVTNVSAKSLGRLQVPELIGQGDTVLTIPK